MRKFAQNSVAQLLKIIIGHMRRVGFMLLRKSLRVEKLLLHIDHDAPCRFNIMWADFSNFNDGAGDEHFKHCQLNVDFTQLPGLRELLK
jgi:hypothetical protein